MESLLDFLGIIFIVFGILQIILFFKLWGMTNDIRDIKDKYMREGVVQNPTKSAAENPTDGKVQVENNMLVIELKTGRQMRVGEQLEDGRYKCYVNDICVGDFDSSEFMESNKWMNEVYLYNNNPQ
jgi:hypothetical protein